jgi:CYTH domain-containing protein
MAIEIEREFLLANDDWKRETIKSEHLRDGLIARFGEGKVRVRLTESGAWLTIKGPRKGISRLEFEFEIPRADAEHMMRTLCQGDPILEKVGTQYHLAASTGQSTSIWDRLPALYSLKSNWNTRTSMYSYLRG